MRSRKRTGPEGRAPLVHQENFP